MNGSVFITASLLRYDGVAKFKRIAAKSLADQAGLRITTSNPRFLHLVVGQKVRNTVTINILEMAAVRKRGATWSKRQRSHVHGSYVEIGTSKKSDRDVAFLFGVNGIGAAVRHDVN